MKNYLQIRKLIGISSSTLREIVLLKGLNHTNIVKLKNVVMDTHKIHLVFELVDVDLKKYMTLHPDGLNDHQIKVATKIL